MSKKNMDIFVAMHKEGSIPTNDSIYKFVQAGAALNKKINNVLYDNIGDNISKLNPYYCELTVLYWGWKNSDAEIKGLCHYRRFLSNSRINFEKRLYLTENQIKDALKDNDIILGEPTYYQYKKNMDTYIAGGCGKEEDLVILRDVLNEFYPEYINAYDKVMMSYKMSYCNMLIASNHIYNAYTEWLFSVLKKLEPRINISDRVGNQKRVYGYLAERLLNVWVMKNMLKIKYYPIVKIEDRISNKYRVKCFLDNIGYYSTLQNIKEALLFKINNLCKK